MGAASWRSRIFYKRELRLIRYVARHKWYLDVARHVVLDRLKSCGAQDICNMDKQEQPLADLWKDLPNNVVRLSAASRNSVVEIALSLEASTGTSSQLFLTVSKKVDMMFGCIGGLFELYEGSGYVIDDCREEGE